MTHSIRLTTRKSKLALWQAQFVKSAIETRYPDITVTLVEVVTTGDTQQHTALADIGGKSNFVKALQTALLDNKADIAVHSMKDMSVYDTPDLTLAAVCKRADARDAFLSTHYADIAALPSAAVVGTASPRRESILKSIRPDINVTLLRGNVDTRLAKLDNRAYDAIILAAAGLIRLDLSHRINTYLSESIFTPAIAQGAIGIECRSNDDFCRDLLRFLHDDTTAVCVSAERRVNQILGGDCHTAIGAYATVRDNQLHLSAMVGSFDGKQMLRTEATGSMSNYLLMGEQVANTLIAKGAREILCA